MSSEIARLQDSIRLEYEAGRRALYDLALVGRHEFITKRMENMEHHFHDLRALLPPEEARQRFEEALDGEAGVSHYEGEV